MKRSLLKRSKSQLKRSPLKKVSRHRESQNREYSKLRKVFLETCPPCPVTGGVATEIHHTNHREGKLLNDVSQWLGVSLGGHRYIHSHPKEARENGWLK